MHGKNLVMPNQKQICSFTAPNLKQWGEKGELARLRPRKGNKKTDSVPGTGKVKLVNKHNLTTG